MNYKNKQISILKKLKIKFNKILKKINYKKNRNEK